MVSGMGVLRLVLPTVKNFRLGLTVILLLTLDDAGAHCGEMNGARCVTRHSSANFLLFGYCPDED